MRKFELKKKKNKEYKKIVHPLGLRIEWSHGERMHYFSQKTGGKNSREKRKKIPRSNFRH